MIEFFLGGRGVDERGGAGPRSARVFAEHGVLVGELVAGGDAEEAEEVDDGGDEGDDGGCFGGGDSVEGSGGADLVTPAVEEEVGDGEEETEEEGVGEVERQDG